jgi:hypothetical protein
MVAPTLHQRPHPSLDRYRVGVRFRLTRWRLSRGSSYRMPYPTVPLARPLFIRVARLRESLARPSSRPLIRNHDPTNAFVRPAKHVFLPLDEIDISQAIRPYNATVVAELARSIREIGLQTPLTCIVRDGRHILVSGRNRLEALRNSALSKPPCASSTSPILRPSYGGSARICSAPN